MLARAAEVAQPIALDSQVCSDRPHRQYRTALKFAFQITGNDRLYYYSAASCRKAVHEFGFVGSVPSSEHQQRVFFLRVTGHHICWPIH